MKRKIFVFILIIVVTLTALLSTGCKEVTTLKDYDFSIDNIVEVRYSSEPYYESVRGRIFGVKCSEEENASEFATVVEAWSKLQSATIVQGKKTSWIFRSGGTTYYEIFFKDGRSLKITRDKADNIFFDDGGKSYRVKNQEDLEDFHRGCRAIVKPELVIGYIIDDEEISGDV